MSAAAAIAATMPELSTWIGRSRTDEEEITLSAVRRIAATFDGDPEAVALGDALPPHWFGLFFADIPRQSAIGPDGHARAGEFLPPIPLPRRMGAGRRVRTPGALRVGDTATRRTEVAAITPKSGRTGEMVLLTMRRTVEARGEVVAVEEFDALYREAVRPGASSATNPPVPAPTEAAWADIVPIDPVQVFRYGAITWNAHRIHYDADYARGTEGYPGVVQNGGLTMHLMADAALRRAPGPLKGFNARLARPMFVGDHMTLRGVVAEGGGTRVWAADKAGFLAAEMTLEFGA
ncbi:FAS1-like dehydratase domain-containing protein [Muricoccus aerilatus]|uniref:FAS1-like dehydratase domain-containing protein n=1 Tax=Muricoccus aerilatus TaxID=452982 RepID=UPI0006949B59|nr:MaoC family dehydratase N-terminal domain-containing protein [Roseomonas aerilata]